MKFKDIPPFTSRAKYSVNVSWKYLKNWLNDHKEINMNPDFQRAHVWNEEKQTKYIEYALRDGVISGFNIYWNHPGWMKDWKGSMDLVDGKQRLQAVLKFLNNEIPAYGSFINEYEDELRALHPNFLMHVNDLPTRKEMLQWYLDLNSGGVLHTEEELDKVRELLKKEA